MRPRRGPNPGQLFEITTCSLDRKLLLRPSKEVNDIIIGVIGRAQLHVDVQLHAFVFMSTHYHLLATAASADDMSKFIGFINCNITRKLNALNKRSGSGWSRRFHSIGVSRDRCTQQRRLRYLLAHGVKENLVRRAQDWPGASSLPWLVRDQPIRGVWTSFTDRYRATYGKDVAPRAGEFDTIYTLKMTPLPCWEAMSPALWRRLVRKMIEELETEATEKRVAQCINVLGARAVLAADPQSRILHKSRTRAPSVHALDPRERATLKAALRLRKAAYEEASQRFRSGEWTVTFPAGMFRPSGGFVA